MNDTKRIGKKRARHNDNLMIMRVEKHNGLHIERETGAIYGVAPGEVACPEFGRECGEGPQ